MKNRMKALVRRGPLDLRVEEMDIPAIGPRDVLLRSRMVSVCGTDVLSYRTGAGGFPNQIFGHEYCADIAAVGEEIKTYRAGERVYGANCYVCGECWYCRHEDYGHCKNVLRTYTGKAQPGAFAQYFVIHEPVDIDAATGHINALVRIPDSMTDEACALIEPFGDGLAIVEKCDVQPGDIVVILGAGAVGNSVMQWAKVRGATTFIVDISKKRLEIAKQCGADQVIDNANGDCYEQIAKIAGEIGWSKASDATPAGLVADCAGYPGSFNDAMRIVRAGGTVCEISETEKQSPMNPTYIAYKDLRIVGSNDCNYIGAMKGIAQGLVNVTPLIDDVVDLDHAVEAFERQADGLAIKILVDMLK